MILGEKDTVRFNINILLELKRMKVNYLRIIPSDRQTLKITFLVFAPALDKLEGMVIVSTLLLVTNFYSFY